ncbi:MBL fold metallo-hydrolase [Roseicyclus sp. F158]|uniref:MBL fold metallo-hydrolase n=1 Tax=Tropicimonas omnivorans TaxID=3075590 RepID=A0ABU3DFV3_9RHOB|nr:MBL fold metallo-hydrolase [Roseicyclus sp. F158]MDT0682017.1 MBL fold metallo-hydrolase [Roseicyclus sp. F158]
MITSPLNAEHDFTKGMHVVLTGSASALPDPFRGGASAAVTIDGTVLQFDCGRMVLENLMRCGINPVEIDELYLTHLHFDHIASFGYFMIASWIASRQEDLPVTGPAGTVRMANDLVFKGHYADVEFGRGLVSTWRADVPGRPRDEPPFTARDVEPGLVTETDKYRITSVEVPHFQQFGMRSLAYRVDCDHGSVVVTGDCRPCPEVPELAKGADVLIQECAKPDGDMFTTGKFSRSSSLEDAQKEHTHPHSTPSWIGEVARKAGVKTVVATHVAPFGAPPASRAMSKVYYGEEEAPEDIFDRYASRIAETFDGNVHVAHDGLILKV